MYVSLSRLRVPADRAGELVAAFRRRARLVDGFDGFVDLQVWQSDRDPGEPGGCAPLRRALRWRPPPGHTRRLSREHQVSHDRIDRDLDAAIKLERLEHMHVVAE